MKALHVPLDLCAVALCIGALSLAAPAGATRPGSATAPAASAVQASAQQPAESQADESASLRQGTIGAIDQRATRVQVQGVWLDVDAANTTLMRNGKPARLDTLKVGEAIRFMVTSRSGGAPMLRVVYAP